MEEVVEQTSVMEQTFNSMNSMTSEGTQGSFELYESFSDDQPGTPSFPANSGRVEAKPRRWWKGSKGNSTHADENEISASLHVHSSGEPLSSHSHDEQQELTAEEDVVSMFDMPITRGESSGRWLSEENPPVASFQERGDNRFDSPDQVFSSVTSTGVDMHQPPVSAHLRSLLIHVLIFTQRPFDFLEAKIEHHRRKLVKQTLSVTFHSASPLTILLHKPAVAVLFFIVGTLQLYFVISDLMQMQAPIVGRTFRFTPLELRSGATTIDHPHIAHFAVVQQIEGCLAELQPEESFIEGKHLFAAFDADTTIHGFQLVTGGAVEDDPVRFSVSVQKGSDPDGEWEVVGYHRAHVSLTGERLPAGRLALPAFRGEGVRVDLRPSSEWPWYAGRGGGGLALGLGLVQAGLSAAVGKVAGGGVPGLYGLWALSSASMLVAGVLHLTRTRTRGDVREGGMWLVYGAVVGAGTAALWWRERRLMRVLLCFGAALLLADLLCHGALVGRGAEDARVSGSHGVLGGWMLGGALLLWLLSASQHRAVSSVLAPDRAEYAEAWRQLRAEEGAEAALGGLERAVLATGARSGGQVVQAQRIRVHAGQGTGADGHAFGSVRERCGWWVRNAWSELVYDTPHDGVRLLPLTNLDQIYSQATCLHPLLRSKVQEWALKCGGMFRSVDGSLVRWEEARRTPEERKKILWGKLKKEDRAIEKVIRCYGEDVSRLVDVCRQSIFFATVGELADCVAEMSKDEGVEVVRVKNRMSLEEDGAASAGFRNVSVNLRIVEEEARSFGVDTHVCEVQLIHALFAARQREEGRHSRYLLYRDYARPRVRRSGACVAWVQGQMGGLWAQGDAEVGRDLRLRARRRSSTESLESQSPRGGGRAKPWLRFGRSDKVGRDEAHGEGKQRKHAAGTLFADASSAPRELDWLFGRAASDSSAGSSVSRSNNRLFRRFSMVRLSQHLVRRGKHAAGPAAHARRSPARDEALLAYRDLLAARNTSSKGKRKNLLDFWKAMEAVSASSVLFIRHPIQGALTKRIWRALAFLFPIVGLAISVSVLRGRYLELGHSFSTFRFTATGTRAAPHVVPPHHGLAAFGAAARACVVFARVEEVRAQANTLTVRYASPVWADSFWVQTSNASADLDPARFWIEGSDDGEVWKTMGSSGWVQTTFDGLAWNDQAASLIWERETFMLLGYSQVASLWNMLQMLSWQSVNPTYIVILVAAIRASYGNLDNVRLVGTGFMLSFVCLLVCGVWGWIRFDPISGQMQILISFMFAIIGLTILFRQRSIFPGVAFAMVYGLVSGELFFRFTCKCGSLQLEIAALEGGVLAVVALAGLIRLHILLASRRMVAEDKRRYDALWAAITRTEADPLGRLQRLCEAPLMHLEAEPRHCYSSVITSGLDRLPSANSGRLRPLPIMDVDQIFAQAMVMYPILLSKVQEWALKCGGMFLMLDGSFVRWEEARRTPEERKKVKWAPLKKEGRAIEKVIRCYGEDVSRLVDVCRQSIFFATAGELADCVAEMSKDEGVEVVRVKNRMSLEEDGAASAGFRNVSVNLRIVEEEARSFGVDTHVCEVQLCLRDFAKLTKSEGHKRYVQFRNVRGE